MLKVERVNATFIIQDPVRLVEVAGAEGQPRSNFFSEADALWVPAELEDLS